MPTPAPRSKTPSSPSSKSSRPASPGSSADPPVSATAGRTSVRLVPLRSALAAGRNNEVEVLVRLQSPARPTAVPGQSRAPLAIALVIDRSGSMRGRPLEEARRCAEAMIDRLAPTDSVALVQFDDDVQRLWPAVPIGDGLALKRLLANLQPGGSTALHGGWLEGADSLVELAGRGLCRVVLLSDGKANVGWTETADIAAACAEWRARGITTSTYGLGEHFNEELMLAMAEAGGGNGYYGDSAEDLMAPFQQEFDLLADLCLRDLRLRISVGHGLPITATLLNELPRVQDGWLMTDLPWNAEAWALLRLDIPATALPPVGERMALFEAGVRGTDLQGREVALERAVLDLPVVQPATYARLDADPLVERRCAELQAASALAAVRRAVMDGRWDEAESLLEAASERFAGNDWVVSVVGAMKGLVSRREQHRVGKELMYSASKMNKRLTARHEDTGFIASAEAAAPAYLRRRALQGKSETDHGA